MFYFLLYFDSYSCLEFSLTSPCIISLITCSFVVPQLHSLPLICLFLSSFSILPILFQCICYLFPLMFLVIYSFKWIDPYYQDSNNNLAILLMAWLNIRRLNRSSTPVCMPDIDKCSMNVWMLHRKQLHRKRCLYSWVRLDDWSKLYKAFESSGMVEKHYIKPVDLAEPYSQKMFLTSIHLLHVVVSSFTSTDVMCSKVP